MNIYLLRLKYDLQAWVKDYPVLKRIVYELIMLRHRPRMWWHKLWIRQDEFHISLAMDLLAMLDMNKTEEEAYSKDLTRRRNIAHNRNLKL